MISAPALRIGGGGGLKERGGEGVLYRGPLVPGLQVEDSSQYLSATYLTQLS